MNKLALAAVLMVGMSGCKKGSPKAELKAQDTLKVSDVGEVIIGAQPPKIDPDIKRLADFCTARGIQWRIQCDSSEDRPSYIGWAIPWNGKFENYIEDGAKPSWFAYSDDVYMPTQAAAARRLYKLLQGKPNDIPRYRPEDKPAAKKFCRKPITSENYTEGEASKCCEDHSNSDGYGYWGTSADGEVKRNITGANILLQAF